MSLSLSQLIILVFLFLFLFTDVRQIYKKIKKELTRKKGLEPLLLILEINILPIKKLFSFTKIFFKID